MEPKRRKTRPVDVGGVVIGGDAPVSVQTMVKTRPDDVDGALRQIREAADAGCDIVRAAVPDKTALAPFADLVSKSPLPVVADIHFNHMLALGAIEAGAAKIRVNPGNMRDEDGTAAVVRAAADAGIPVRIGVNSGSIGVGADELDALGERMADAAIAHCERFEALGFRDIVISLKAPDAPTTLAANLATAERCDYPLHIGVTEAGPEEDALLKSAVGIGGLLAQGVGDTVRVSFTGPPAREVTAARAILRASGVLRDRPEIISCPTCGRCRVDLRRVVEEVRARLSDVRVPLTVAVMGCEVNGPGEASHADIGIAAGTGTFTLFADGERVCTVDERDAVERLFREIDARIAAPEGRS